MRFPMLVSRRTVVPTIITKYLSNNHNLLLDILLLVFQYTKTFHCKILLF